MAVGLNKSGVFVFAVWQSCGFDCAVFCPNIQHLFGQRSEGLSQLVFNYCCWWF